MRQRLIYYYLRGAFFIEKGLKRTALTDDEDWFTNLKDTPDLDDDDIS